MSNEVIPNRSTKIGVEAREHSTDAKPYAKLKDLVSSIVVVSHRKVDMLWCRKEIRMLIQNRTEKP